MTVEIWFEFASTYSYLTVSRWRDVARRAERFGLPFQRPDIFPANGLNAARIMTATLDQPWCGEFARAVFQAQFVRGEDISQFETLAAALQACGVEPELWFDQAQSDAVKAALRQHTEDAQAHGLFGAPSFLVQGELCWGDDRREDAIAWAQAHPS